MISSPLKPVLVVEDSAEDFTALGRAFRKHALQHPVLRCEDGDQALTYLQGYGDLMVRVNGWDPAGLERFRADERLSAHSGALDATDDLDLLRHARDVYTRRNEGVSLWVVRSSSITASSPDEKDPMFAPAGDKVYRHPTFYSIPDDVPHM